jgi:hypothetical protein
MHASSVEFAESINEAHVVVETVEFIYPEGDAGPSFAVEDGNFEIDSDAPVRHNASFQLGSEDVNPAEVKEALSIPGVSVRYSRGMRLASGQPETKRVLTGQVSVGEIGGSREGIDPIPLTVFDSMTRLQWEASHAYSVRPGVNYATAMKDFVTQYAPEIEWADLMSTPWTVPALTFPVSAIPATFVADMAKAVGAEVYFDAFDRLNIAPIPLTYGRPEGWRFDCDDPASGVLHVKYRAEHDKIPNKVIVVGQHSSLQGNVQGEAADDNPTSKTYIGIRERSITKRTEKAITITQANAMARGLLEKLLGGAEEIILKILPNPLLVEGALCHVSSERYGINGNYVLKGISGGAGRKSVGEPWTVTLRRGLIPANAEAV